MKIVFAFILLSLTSSAFAAGSWRISCTSETGVSFHNDNGQAEIQFSSIDANGSIKKTSSNVAIENYQLGLDKKDVVVSWVGKQSIIDDRYENSCNRDEVVTVFSQQVKITNAKKKTSQIVNVVCREEIITSSGAEQDECAN